MGRFYKLDISARCDPLVPSDWSLASTIFKHKLQMIRAQQFDVQRSCWRWSEIHLAITCDIHSHIPMWREWRDIAFNSTARSSGTSWVLETWKITCFIVHQTRVWVLTLVHGVTSGNHMDLGADSSLVSVHMDNSTSPWDRDQKQSWELSSHTTHYCVAHTYNTLLCCTYTKQYIIVLHIPTIHYRVAHVLHMCCRYLKPLAYPLHTHIPVLHIPVLEYICCTYLCSNGMCWNTGVQLCWSRHEGAACLYQTSLLVALANIPGMEMYLL